MKIKIKTTEQKLIATVVILAIIETLIFVVTEGMGTYILYKAATITRSSILEVMTCLWFLFGGATTVVIAGYVTDIEVKDDEDAL